MWHIGRTAILGIVLALPAFAQEAATAPVKPPRVKLLRDVTASCKVDYQRFCPTSRTGRISGGDEVLCLKFYRSDLSLGCRHAISAAQQ